MTGALADDEVSALLGRLLITRIITHAICAFYAKPILFYAKLCYTRRIGYKVQEGKNVSPRHPISGLYG
jgi:hypothetical protein